MELWKEYAFSPIWWFLVALFILPWVAWWFLVDRQRIMAIFGVGTIVAMLANLLDTFGIVLGKWIYLIELLPPLPQLLPMDYAVLPVGYMLAYQYAPAWRKYSIVAILFSSLGAFVIEPIFVKLHIYVLLDWSHWYSAIIYFLIAIFVKWLVDHVFLGK